MESRLAAQGLHSGGGAEGAGQSLPVAVHAEFSEAMSQAMLLPAVVLALGCVAALFFQMPRHLGAQPAPVVPAAQQD